jgi:hypothetical protein
MAMFEILNPSDQRAIDIFDDYLQALAVRPLGFSTIVSFHLTRLFRRGHFIPRSKW